MKSSAPSLALSSILLLALSLTAHTLVLYENMDRKLLGWTSSGRRLQPSQEGSAWSRGDLGQPRLSFLNFSASSKSYLGAMIDRGGFEVGEAVAACLSAGEGRMTGVYNGIPCFNVLSVTVR